LIEVRNLVFRYNNRVILDDLSFTLNEDETTVVIGRSGVGKSTLLRCILGLVKPDFGSIIVNGSDVTSITEEELNLIRRDFGMLFQGAALFNSMTVGENVAFPLRQHRDYDEHTIKSIVSEKLELVDLGGTSIALNLSAEKLLNVFEGVDARAHSYVQTFLAHDGGIERRRQGQKSPCRS